MQLIKSDKKHEYLAVYEEEIYGKGYIYESLSSEIYHEVRTNFFIDSESDDEDIRRWIVQELLDICKNKEIKTSKGRVYHCCFSTDEKNRTFYSSVPEFEHDEGMYVLKKILSKKMPVNKVFCYNHLINQDSICHFIEMHETVFAGHPYSLEKIEYMLREQALFSIGLYENKELKANVLILKEDDQWYIEDLFVHKSARRQGVARELMHAAHSYLYDQGVRMVFLEVWSSNERARALYDDLGYVFERETEISIGVNIPL